jgi:hypothetical protein
MLEQFIHSLESRLLKLGQFLWRPDTRASRLEEAEHLIDQLQKLQGRLSSEQGELESTHRRLTRNHTAAVLLVAQIESCIHRGVPDQAYPHSLELERVRQALAEDRAALPRQEQRCWSLQFQVRQVERRLAHVQEELYCGEAKA